MPVPRHIANPQFDIVRSSHIALGVTDVGRSRAFYEETLGLHVEEATPHTVYLRGMEERQHHSLVLVQSKVPLAHALGFRVGGEEDLDRAEHWARANGLKHAFVERAYQGRTLQIIDPWGLPIEITGRMEKRENLLQR